MRRALCFLLAVCSTTTLLALNGVILTLDGRRLEGEIEVGRGGLVIKLSQGGTATIAATNISRAQFSTNVIAAQTKGSGNGLLGIYYNTTNCSGTTLMRLDQTVDFDWQDKAPALGVPRNAFSVRWMGQLEVPTSDSYIIHFGTDDGGRIYLDDKLVADHWGRHDYAETNVTVKFQAGEKRKLKLEYFDSIGNARARLFWSTPSMAKTIIPQDRLYAASFDSEHKADSSGLAGSQGLLATYYNRADFTGNSFSRIDPEISFDWKDAAPADGIESNHFSVRWSGKLLVTNSGVYRLYILGGLPLRFFINDKLLSNPLFAGAAQQVVSTTLRAGDPCDLSLEMSATNQLMPVKLSWSSDAFPKTLLPRQHLSPAIAPSRDTPLNYGLMLPAGVVLLSGATIGATIQSANESSIRFQGVFAKQSLPLTTVARIHVKPLATDFAAGIPPGRAGVLLKNRDFIDGDFAGIENGRLKIGSVLFGHRSFDMQKDVMVIVLRGKEPPPGRWSITARDGTVLRGKSMSIEPTRVGITGAPEFSIAPADVTEIAYRSDGEPAH